MNSEILVERHGPVAALTINRPQRRNALSDALVARLRELLQRNDSDAAIRATVLTGCAPGFCAGSDLKELAHMSLDEMCAHEARTAAFCREIAQLDKPVIAAVEGFALGGGFVLAASCDVIVAGSSVRWNLPEVEIGWIPPWGLETLVNRVGVSRARQLSWGGQVFTSDEALRLGLVDHLAENGQALPRAIEIAQMLARLPLEAVASTKLYFAAHAARNGESGDALASRMFKENCRTETAKATLRRFGVKA
ncbi:enoyl-CoA hydratase/isomerase family protein [Piscinibacter sp.]|uniref:enoyl-CoA hydratase/isomerase family protein n=1 Tax=Piscinibacter sp. TaxID=1903157 RepID=UPI0039E69000